MVIPVRFNAGGGQCAASFLALRGAYVKNRPLVLKPVSFIRTRLYGKFNA